MEIIKKYIIICYYLSAKTYINNMRVIKNRTKNTNKKPKDKTEFKIPKHINFL